MRPVSAKNAVLAFTQFESAAKKDSRHSSSTAVGTRSPGSYAAALSLLSSEVEAGFVLDFLLLFVVFGFEGRISSTNASILSASSVGTNTVSGCCRGCVQELPWAFLRF